MQIIHHSRKLSRKHRKRVRKKRDIRRRNLSKFIPQADSDFAYVAWYKFARPIQSDPAAHGLTADDAAVIAAAVGEFRTALAQATHCSTRTQITIMDKDVARAKAEAVVRKYGRLIRANPDMSSSSKMLIRIKEPATKLKKRALPKTRPVLHFVGSVAESQTGKYGLHVLRVSAMDMVLKPSGGKPEYGPRVELFVDLVPPGEPVPNHPAERTGREWYVRSFTRRKFEVRFPMPSIPMLVVYWARWADASGEVGVWSKTCVARVEGWSANPNALPTGDAQILETRRVETKYVFIQTPIAGELPEQIAQQIAVSQERLLTSSD